jgi:hypothetical protein
MPEDATFSIFILDSLDKALAVLPTVARKSPEITYVAWGVMDVEGLGRGADFKVYPGGGRAWNWTETGTHHVPGIQPADVQELLDHGSEVVILSRGVQLALQVCPETLELLDRERVRVIVADTPAAVIAYNELAAKGQRVGGLFHSTC